MNLEQNEEKYCHVSIFNYINGLRRKHDSISTELSMDFVNILLEGFERRNNNEKRSNILRQG